MFILEYTYFLIYIYLLLHEFLSFVETILVVENCGFASKIVFLMHVHSLKVK